MQTIEDKIVSRIYGRGRGWAFSSNDFVEDLSPVAAASAFGAGGAIC